MYSNNTLKGKKIYTTPVADYLIAEDEWLLGEFSTTRKTGEEEIEEAEAKHYYRRIWDNDLDFDDDEQELLSNQ